MAARCSPRADPGKDKGLVARLPHPTDARARALSVTPEGIEIANRANGAVEAVDREYLGVLGDDRPQFTRMLARLPK